MSSNLTRYTHPSRLYRWHLRRFHDRIADWIACTKARTVLEVGCGEGYVLAHLSDRLPGCQFVGCDVRPEALKYASRICPAERVLLLEGTAYQLPLADVSFELVLATEVLEHLQRPDAALAELQRVSARWVLVTVPLEPIFEALNRLGLWMGIAAPAGHVHFWGPAAFRRWMRSHLHRVRFGYEFLYQMALGEV
jgi:SAM-dependent methyltransferase